MALIFPFKGEKQTLFYITVFFVFCNSFLFSQSINHPTINQLEVAYVDEDNYTLDTIKVVKVQSIITLKSDSLVSLIHFKIIKESDDSSVYQADYSAASTTIINNEGLILFKKEGNTIYINSSSNIPLKMYQYHITTEDAQGNISEPFIELH